MNANKDLRMLARGACVPLWAVADRLGCSDQKLFRDWRHELSDEDKQRIRQIIAEIKTGGESNAENPHHQGIIPRH